MTPTHRSHLHLLGPTPGLLSATSSLTDSRAAPLPPLLPPGKPFALLALLALEPDGLTREELIAYLWPDAPPERARASVRQALHVVRKAAGTEAIVESDGHLTLAGGALDSDLGALERARIIVDDPTPGVFGELDKRLRAARRALAADAAEGDATVVRVKALDTERSLPLGLAAELAKSLSSRPGAAGMANASLAVLRHLVPTLGNGSVPASSGSLSEVAVSEALLDVAEAVAGEGPLVLWVDDLQWADMPSRAVFLRVARSLRGAQILVLVTCRSGDADLSAVRTLRAEAAAGRFSTLQLAPLTPGEVLEALLLSMDVIPAEAVGRVARRIARASQGNPLFLAELVLRLHAEGFIRDSAGHWVLDASGVGEDLPLPSSVREILQARLGEVPAELRPLLAVLAHAPTPLGPEELARRTSAPPEVARARLVTLAGQGILAPDESARFVFAHDSLRAIARDLFPAPKRPGLLQRIPRWALAGGALAALAAVAAGAALAAPWLRRPDPVPLYPGVIYYSEPGLVRYDLATGDSLVLLSPPHHSGGRWFPDGGAISAFMRGAEDTLARRRSPWGRFTDTAAPCGPTGRRSVALRWVEGVLELVTWDWGSDAVQTVGRAGLPLVQRFMCSPYGGAAVAVARVRGDNRIMVIDLATGDTLLGPAGQASQAMGWMPDAPLPVPSRVEAAEPTMEMQWGASRPVSAAVALADGTVRFDHPVEWSSLDPTVASVRDGVLYANGVGAASIVASVQGWIADTVHVTVTGTSLADQALLADRFRTLDTTAVWATYGTPAPAVAEADDGPAVALRGDGVGTDGIISRARFDLSRGATLEVSFRFPITRTDRQRFDMCPGSGPPPVDRGTFLPAVALNEMCFGTPMGEFVWFDPQGFAFFPFNNLTPPPGRSRLLPADTWRRVSVVMAPDGNARLLLNQQEAARLPWPMENGPEARWYVRLAGHSVDTQLLVRDLVLWEGMRY